MSLENSGTWNGTGHGAERQDAGTEIVSWELDDEWSFALEMHAA